MAKKTTRRIGRTEREFLDNLQERADKERLAFYVFWEKKELDDSLFLMAIREDWMNLHGHKESEFDMYAVIRPEKKP